MPKAFGFHWRVIGWLFFLAAFAWLKISFGMLICDDAYITLAHARSWNSGLRPIMSLYNPVCATSTPLHTLILALLAALFRTQDYVTLAFYINLVWDLIAFLFLYKLALQGLKMSPPMALLSVAAYAMSVNFLAVSAYGMETPMVVALALACTWYALYSPKPIPGIICVSFLAPLARPEGALLPGLLIILFLRRTLSEGKYSRVMAWKWAFLTTGIAMLGFACFFFFYQYAYGNWLPHSVIAKRLELNIGAWEGLESWIMNVFYKGPTTGGVRTVTVVNSGIVMASLLGYLKLRRLGPSSPPIPWAILVWPGCYFLFFMATGSSYILFTWYYLPVLPFLIVFLLQGLERLRQYHISESWTWVLVLGFILIVPIQTLRQKIPQKHRLAEEVREGRYRQAGHLLDSLSISGKPPWVMIDEVGALGYYSKVRILDSHGLLSPEALPFLKGSKDSYFQRLTAMQEKCDPDWILAMRLVEDEGKWLQGEDGLYAGYESVFILRRPPHGYNFEMWRRTRDN